MKKAALSVCILAMTAVAGAAAESPGKIIDRYKKSSGGSAVERIKSTVMTGTLAGASSGSFQYVTAKPDRLRIEVEIGGNRVIDCYNGKSAWRKDAAGLRTLLGSEAKSLRLLAIILNNRLRNLSHDRIIPVASGSADVEGRSTNFVELQLNGVSVKLFFDAKDGSLVKLERDTSEGREAVFFADYRASDGVMEPFSVRVKRGATEMTAVAATVEHNRAIEESQFLYPKAEGASLPSDVEPLMKSLVANQERIEELRQHYTFLETETERKLDRDGKVKESETHVYEVTPVGSSFVRRLVKNGNKELSASELEKEDRRIQKEIEDIQKREEKRKKRKDRAKERGEEDDNERVTILSFLRVSEITSIRREMFRGHEVIAFDFEPRKGFKPSNRVESIVSKLAGTMWVDEQARQIARLEARLTDSFKVGGGLLASILPSTAFAFEQEKIGGELWLPSHAEANLAAKIFLLAKFNRSMTTDYSEYKKYKIDSDYKLKPPTP